MLWSGMVQVYVRSLLLLRLICHCPPMQCIGWTNLGWTFGLSRVFVFKCVFSNVAYVVAFEFSTVLGSVALRCSGVDHLICSRPSSHLLQHSSRKTMRSTTVKLRFG